MSATVKLASYLADRDVLFAQAKQEGKWWDYTRDAAEIISRVDHCRMLETHEQVMEEVQTAKARP